MSHTQLKPLKREARVARALREEAMRLLVARRRVRMIRAHAEISGKAGERARVVGHDVARSDDAEEGGVH